LRPILADRFALDSTAAWMARLSAAEIPCGPIADIAAAFASPEAAARGMRTEVEHPVLGRLAQVGIPIEFTATPGAIRRAPPLLGEDTDEILAEVGYSVEDVAALRAGGAI
jgi:crotonobetainyl-CoA:carnitine CoA-transferase CaiB-like acyl-CoA transferase